VGADLPIKKVYFDCFSGVSGNMIIGALLDAGMPLHELLTGLDALNLDGYEIKADKVTKSGIAATHFDVILKDEHHHHEDVGHHHHRNLADIVRIIETSELNAHVKDMSLAIFYRLAEAEAAVHGVGVDQVHFHEVGAVDAIIDIVGAAIAFDYLGIEEVYSSPLTLGSGTIKCDHGILPVPAPATAELIKGVPITECNIKTELTTPTGAAIITTMARGYCSLPTMKIEKIGVGAGTKDLKEQPNICRVFLGKNGKNSEPLCEDTVLVLTTNIDDSTPEILGYMMERLFEEHALDVSYTPITMKKNRPGVTMTVIALPESEETMLDIIFSESSTLGVRKSLEKRAILPRKSLEIETVYGKLAVKATEYKGKTKLAAEFESAVALAKEKRVPLRAVYDALAKEKA